MSESTIALEISSQNRIVFQGKFPSLNAAQDFSAWWANQPSLPQGGAIHQDSEAMVRWRDANPLPVDTLTVVQRQLIAAHIKQSCTEIDPCEQCQWADREEKHANAAL